MTALLVTGMMRGHHGGFLNVFIPLHWVLAFGFAMVAAQMRDNLSYRTAPLWVSLIMTAQIGLSYHDLKPDTLKPTEADWAAGDELVAAITQHEGPVLSVFNPWLAVQAGHEPSFHLISLWDIKHQDGPFRARADAITRAVKAHQWGVIVDANETMGYGVQKYYKPSSVTIKNGKAMMPKTGWRRRPKVLMVPK